MAALVAASFFAVAAGTHQGPAPVRVKLTTVNRPIMLEGEFIEWDQGKPHRMTGPVRISYNGREVMFEGKPARLPFRLHGGDKVTMDGETFRGQLLVTDTLPPLVVNLVDVESYVAGVLNQEIDARWPEAAVDAQAILARTYAQKRAKDRRDQDFDLDRSVTDQVYGGMAAEDEPAWASVRRTRGQVLCYAKALAEGLYHSCCGGRTELPSEVWGGQGHPYQRSVVCPYCQDAPRYFWRWPERGVVGGEEFGRTLGMGSIEKIEVRDRTLGGRARTVEVWSGGRSHRFSGTEFRKLMGYDRIWSAAFEVESEEGFVFRGSGSGHGVGLCQWGARGMANQGFSCRAILEHYFPGTEALSWNNAMSQ